MADSPPQFGAAALDDFLMRLRRQGFTISPAHHLRLQLLLTKVGGEVGLKELKTLLCPIFATNEKEQERFYQIFDLFLEQFKIAIRFDAEHTTQNGAGDPLDIRKLLTPRLKIILTAVAIGLIAVLILNTKTELIRYVTSVFRSPLSLPTPTPVATEPHATNTPILPPTQAEKSEVATPTSTPSPTPTPTPEKNWGFLSGYPGILAVVLSPLILIFLVWLWKLRQKSVLERARGHKPPFTWQMQVEATEIEDYRSERFYKAARLLRRRQMGEFHRLDIPSTIEATISALGYPNFRYRPDSRSPEYLILIDRDSPGDHQSRLFDSLSQALDREGIFLSRYFYNGDPQVCWSEIAGPPVHLVDLQKKYLTHRLLIFGDGKSLTDPISGRLAQWATMLLEWPERAVMTPQPVASWGFLEKTLADHFIFLPATTAGLGELVNRMESPAGSEIELWAKDDIGSDAPDPDRPVSVAELREYLGEKTFQWLCVCAVYPELNWELTLYLASLPYMDEELIQEENLLKLTHLSWFREGVIPDDVRLRLIDELDPLREREIRSAIIELLNNTKLPGESFAEYDRRLNIAVQQSLLNRDDPRELLQAVQTPAGPEPHELLSDYTLIRFLNSSPSSRLAILLPLKLQQLFRKTGLSVFGLNTLVRMSASLMLTTASWFNRSRAKSDKSRPSLPMEEPPTEESVSLPARTSSQQAVFQLLTYVYLLRFPIMTAIFLITLPYLSLVLGGAALLGGLFDLNAAGILAVTLMATLSAWSVMVTSRLVLLYSGERFLVSSLRIEPRLRWSALILFGLLAAPIIVVIYLQVAGSWGFTSAGENWLRLAAPVAAILLALSLIRIAHLFRQRLNSPETNHLAPDLLMPSSSSTIISIASEAYPVIATPNWLGRRLKSIPAFSGRGYVDYEADPADRFPLLPGHGFGLCMTLVFLMIYVMVGVISSPWLTSFRAPSLAGALLLLTTLNWGLSGLAFFFDRYRVPVLTLIALSLGLSAMIFSRSDSYYFIYPQATNTSGEFGAQKLVDRRDGAKVILVAAGGAGIQASAWTARVLAGIEESCRNGGSCGGRSFARSVRLISAVSGGSVGAMYFVNAYRDDGNLPPDRNGLEEIVRLAERSSLDGWAWGLFYPDFLRVSAPFLSEVPFFWKTDRGRALEFEWQRGVELKARLGEWRRDTMLAKRPGVVFHTTMVETGSPLLFSTIEHDQSTRVAKTFDRLYAGYDVPVTSAVRLSATQPYISPASRAHRDDRSDLSDAEYHLVDGGYYDSYGVATLIEWLDNELQKPAGDLTELMVIRIHSMPVETDRTPSASRGFIYQTAMPLVMVDNIRGGGQLSRSNLQTELFQKRWSQREGRKVAIETVTFEYPNGDGSLCWHLNERQKQAIEAAWREQVSDPNPGSALNRLKKFLND